MQTWCDSLVRSKKMDAGCDNHKKSIKFINIVKRTAKPFPFLQRWLTVFGYAKCFDLLRRPLKLTQHSSIDRSWKVKRYQDIWNADCDNHAYILYTKYIFCFPNIYFVFRSVSFILLSLAFCATRVTVFGYSEATNDLGILFDRPSSCALIFNPLKITEEVPQAATGRYNLLIRVNSIRHKPTMLFCSIPEGRNK